MIYSEVKILDSYFLRKLLFFIVIIFSNSYYYYFQIVMDPMRALASLEFVSARGLDTSDQGPTILANQVMPPQKSDGCLWSL